MKKYLPEQGFEPWSYRKWGKCINPMAKKIFKICGNKLFVRAAILTIGNLIDGQMSNREIAVLVKFVMTGWGYHICCQ